MNTNTQKGNNALTDILSMSDEKLMSQKENKYEDKPKTKLTGWRKEPTLQELKSDLNNAKIAHQKLCANLDKWERLYNPEPFGDKNHKGSRIQPKQIRKQAEWRASSMSEPFLGTPNLFEVRPLTHEDVPRARQNALILNRQFNTQLNKVKLVDSIIRSVVKNGTAIVRVGWDYQDKKEMVDVPQFEYIPLPPDMVEQMAGQYEQLAMMKQTQPDSYENLDEATKAGFEMSKELGQLVMARQIGSIQEEQTKIISNKPTAELCQLSNLYIDPTCGDDIDKAQFVIYSYESGLSDLKKAGMYKNLDKLSDLNDDAGHDSSYDEHGFMFSDKARKKFVVYEYWGYWDIHGNGQTSAIVASWIGNTLIRLDDNPFPDGKPPFVVFNYIPEENEIFGIPDAQLLEDNQKILGAITRGAIDLMGKSANSQTGFAKGLLDVTNKRKFMNGEDYEFNPNTNPQTMIYTHKFPEIPNSALTMINMMHNDAEALSGIKAFSGGGLTSAHMGDTAVGIRGVLDAVSKREMSILRRISDGFIKMGFKIMSMNSEFLSEQEVVRVTNSEFVQVRREDLAGEFDLTLTISTAEADDAKAKELSFMLQTLGNTMGQEISQLILSEIAELRKMPELAKKIRDYKPEPDEITQQIQELQIQELQAKIELMRAEAMEKQAKSEVQSAKVGVEKARAESLQGDADNKALDFIERDDGTKHRRDIEKQAMINKGQTDKLNTQHNNNMLANLANRELNQTLNQTPMQRLGSAIPTQPNYPSNPLANM